ncbi:spore germination protein [Caloramator quimbayensis]|uniref:Spore germination protein n=1 Tax=Caloramator quimbayensis TaxID=1147123 RepID=A0A1T4WG24_9CLOT|nr:spore germination protein [Caloramator quimbayensis]SKA76263.1 spore germination protein [Caloramator quimbayensis]
MSLWNKGRFKSPKPLVDYKIESRTDISEEINNNITKIKETFKGSDDVVFREFVVGGLDGRRMFLSYIDGMSDKALLDDFVLMPLMLISREVKPDYEEIKDNLANIAKNSALTVTDFKEVEKMEDVYLAVLSGETALFIDGYSKAIIIATRLWPARNTSEPSAETVIRGPRDGFVETLRFNTALIRRRIRDTKFKVKQLQVGQRSKTDVAIMYIDDIADKRVVEEVEKRIKKIDIDAVIDSGYIQQLIEERQFTPFPQVQTTERPDVVAGAIYEGRVGILVDNSPFALIVPVTLNAFLQSSEDYYSRSSITTFVRFLRLISGAIAIIAPGTYIGLISFNPGVIPSKLLFSISASREGVPFPAYIEAFVMELTIEFLREAGVRLPRPIGSTIGIVGGLVIGQAAVQAGIVSPIMVIVVAVTAISSFAIPNYEVAAGFRLIRFFLMILASIYGLYGVMLGIIATLIHLVNIKSFGVPYMAPLAPFEIEDIKDSAFVRLSWKYMKKRPKHLDPQDEIRQRSGNNDTK